MPVLAPGVVVRSRQPTLLVENEFAAGSYLFRLTVVDDAGRESSPAELVVRVVARIPGPIIDPGPLIPGPVIPGPVITRPVVGPVIDPGRVIGPERVSVPTPRRPGGRRATRPATKAAAPKAAAPKAAQSRAAKPDAAARPAKAARRPRTRKKPKP